MNININRFLLQEGDITYDTDVYTNEVLIFNQYKDS